MTAPALDSLLLEELPTRDGHRIGMATLNEPGTLNGLTLEMAERLTEQLGAWAAADGLVLVVLRAAGERAFCAGGDLHGLYQAMQANAGSGDPLANEYAQCFFATEYRLDFLIHTYPKPILCWGHGIVMGGGVGLMAGASHRVATERTRIAMPELGVGLFPDVGGSWFLPRCPGKTGLFLALTGAPLNGQDAIFAGLADFEIRHDSLDSVLTALGDREWTGDPAEDGARLSTVLREAEPPDLAPGPLRQNFDRVHDLCRAGTLEQFLADARAMDTGGDAWFSQAVANLDSAAPSSTRVAWELQHRASRLSLADVLRLEYIVALHCNAHGDFQEGIRALLIDKDRQPKWTPSSLDEASPAWIERFFVAPWGKAEKHPLGDLTHLPRED